MERYIKFEKCKTDEVYYNSLKASEGAFVLNEGTDNESILVCEEAVDSFFISAFSRADFESMGYDASMLTNTEMRDIAKRMGERYCDGSFWYDLEYFAEEFKLPKLKMESNEVMAMHKNCIAINDGKLPNYARVNIKWKDNNELKKGFIIRLWDDYPNENVNDEQIFFYCNGINELIELMNEDYCEDFQIIEVTEFFFNL